MVAPYIKDKHDFGVLRTDGSTKVGMMLMKDKAQLPFWSVADDEYLASQFFTGEPGYASLPAEKELAIRQSSWRAGFGLEVYDPLDSERYRSSIGMDMRFKSMAIAGPKATSIAMPTPAITSPLFANMEFEATTSWTGGARSNAVAAKKGSYEWAITTAGVDAYQDSSVWDNAWRSKAFTFGCWIRSTSGTGVTFLRIDDGIGNTDSSTSTSATFTLLTVTRTLSATATRLRISARHDQAETVYMDWAYVTSSDAPVIGACTAMCDFNDKLYYAFGCSLYKLNGTGDGFTIVQTFHTKITGLEVFGSNLYIALGTAETYWQMSTAEAFTRNDLAANYAQFIRTVHAATPVFWINDGVNTLRSSTNPAAGGSAYSGQTTVASDADEITGLFSEAGLLYVPKEDMPYYLNSSGAVQNDLAPELATLARSTDNGKRAAWWLHKFYLPWGRSLLEEDGGTLTWRNPNDFATDLSDFAGQVFAVFGDDRYLFAILDNSTKIEVLAGRLEVIDGTTKWVWHPINETTLTGCELAFVSSIYQKRLWITSTAVADAIYYIPLPLSYGNVLSDTNRAFQTGTTMETPWLHGNFREIIKAFPKLELVMGHAYDADIYFTVKYKLLEDTAWTSIGNYTGSSTSMIQSRFIPADASSNNPKSTMFKLQFTAVTDDTTKTPVLLSYKLKALLYPDQREIIACKVYCANEILLRDGTKDPGSYDTIIATLNEARTATWPVTIYDINGDAFDVKFLPLPSGVPRWRPIGYDKERIMEREYNLLMMIVALS